MVRKIPNSVSISAQQLVNDCEEIETLILGASQNKRAINPEYLSQKAMTVAGTRQGHKTDYYLLRDLHKQLPSLKRVVLGTTYRHFESRPNSKNFWKYRSHLLYYNVNAFERPTYFKDKLIFLGNPNFYTKQLADYYIKNNKYEYNRFGFQLTGQIDRFAKYNYDRNAIFKSYKPNNYKVLSTLYLDFTTQWFSKVIDYCKANNLELIIAKTPTFENYREHQDPAILGRRDSIVARALSQNAHLSLFDQEESPDYLLTDYLNENHLNPRGAEKFTKKLDAFINKRE